MPDEKKNDNCSEKVEKETNPQQKCGRCCDEKGSACTHSEAGEQEPQDPSAEEPTDRKADQPQPEFAVLVSSLATQAFIGLGAMEHPISKKKEVDLTSAKFSIDLIQMLTAKTKGNLTELEKRYLETILYDLRMKFVDISSKK